MKKGIFVFLAFAFLTIGMAMFGKHALRGALQPAAQFLREMQNRMEQPRFAGLCDVMEIEESTLMQNTRVRVSCTNKKTNFSEERNLFVKSEKIGEWNIPKIGGKIRCSLYDSRADCAAIR